MIENTSENMELAGQAQAVKSALLPTDLGDSTQEGFEALGFTFGDPQPDHPAFRTTTLPDGWKRQERDDRTTESCIVDQLGRARIGIFHPPLPGDRRTFMRIRSLSSYVSECADHGRGVITDDSWATPAAVLEAAREGVTRWTSYESGARFIGADPAHETAQREAYEALVARLEKAGQE
ncbi:hypothetical protein AB0M87_04675 [Streptomyces sp. NPDC051320]|uniref:hypothetical protein n=1 Tax=Streptomyces sp. NPDC051320 TaxID=3154644 RepID=UPI00344A9653